MLTRILALLLAAYLFIGRGIVSERADQIITAAGLLAVFVAYVWESHAGRFGPRPSASLLVVAGVVTIGVLSIAWLAPQRLAQPVFIGVILVGLLIAGFRWKQARDTT